MKRIRNISLLVLIILSGMSCTGKLTVSSPDKNNSITLELNDKGTLYYSIQSHGTVAVMKSLMGMDIADSTLNFNSGLSFVKRKESVIDESYTLPTGKTSVYVNKANESVFSFKNRYNKQISVVCRAFNDGIAFRYLVESPGEITITKENTRFSIPQNSMSWMMDYIPSYEGFYQERLLDTIGIKDGINDYVYCSNSSLFPVINTC